MNRFRVTGYGLRVGCASACALSLLLAACSSTPQRSTPIERSATAESNTKHETRNPKPATGGGYYLDDGPGDNPPPNLEAIPDAEPKLEPLHKFANNPYTALGQEYVPDTSFKPYKAKGLASWYGRRFHGKRTSSGEPYDMYGMTAAHPTLPIPSYVRVTNPSNNKSVVVRVNDRGPFHSSRVIDLSYTAAYKLGIVQSGSGTVEVERINPLDIVAKPKDMPAETVVLSSDKLEPAPQPISSGDIYLQLGAFAAQQNAESFSTRAKLKLGALADALQVFSKDGKYRVHMGPYHSESEVEKVIALVKKCLNISPLRVVR
jgi:rare lipoprotein A